MKSSHLVRGWITVVLSAVVMLATLPGRTQGLGLITEPLLRDLHVDRLVYANINLWATLVGAVVCIPFGSLLDRLGLRWTTTTVVLLLGGVVWAMSLQHGNVTMLFLLILATRALGQSALSVASITAVGKAFGQEVGWAMGVYSVLVGVGFAAAFGVVGAVISSSGWRVAWGGIAIALLAVVAPLTALLLRSDRTPQPMHQNAKAARTADSLALLDALRTPAFWIFAGAAALFNLASSGLGLFNEAVLAERGFNADTFHTFLIFTAGMGLVGQMLCGWLSLRWSMQPLLATAMVLYAIALASFPFLITLTELWIVATITGMAGGFIIVIFFAIWSQAFGRAHLGWIQGAAQMLTVLASAIGPLVFAACHDAYGTYTPALWTLGAVVLVVGAAALRVKLPSAAPLPATTS